MSISRCAGARSTACWAQRSRQDDHDPHAGHAARARLGFRAGARPRHPGRARRGPRTGQPHRPDGLGRRGPDRAREPDPAGPAAGLQARRGQHQGGRAAERLRPRRRRRAPGQELLGRNAAPAGHSRQPGGHPGADVPGRAHHWTRSAFAQSGVGHHPCPGGRGHHDPALHPVSRRGRPAGRRDRRDRPRQSDRRGHAGPAQGVGRVRQPARAPARSRPAPAGRAAAVSASSTRFTWSPIRRRCPSACADADRAAEAVAGLTRAGISIADFSLGQPSLDEVFMALTGHPAEESGSDNGTANEKEHAA